MKVKIFLLATIAIMSCFSVKAQDTPFKAIPDTTKVTFTKVYNDVKSGLKGLREALKVGSEHVYQVMVRQQVINAITDVMAFVFCIIIWFIFYKLMKASDFDRVNWQSVVGVIIGILNSAFLVVLLFCLSTILTGFLNPEYGAIKDIVEFIKPR